GTGAASAAGTGAAGTGAGAGVCGAARSGAGFDSGGVRAGSGPWAATLAVGVGAGGRSRWPVRQNAATATAGTAAIAPASTVRRCRRAAGLRRDVTHDEAVALLVGASDLNASIGGSLRTLGCCTRASASGAPWRNVESWRLFPGSDGAG